MMLSSAAARRGLRAPGLCAAVLTAARGPLLALSTVADGATPAIAAPVAAEATPTVAGVIALHSKLSELHEECIAMRMELEKAELDHAKAIAECKREVGMNARRTLIVGGSLFVILSTLLYASE